MFEELYHFQQFLKYVDEQLLPRKIIDGLSKGIAEVEMRAFLNNLGYYYL